MSVAPVGRQVRYWDIPLLTAGAMARDFGVERQNYYNMLTRVGVNFNQPIEV